MANASANWPLALIALITVIIFNIWGKGMLKIIPILMGVVIAYIAAIIMQAMGITNADGSAIIFGMSRINFRKLAYLGQIPGVKKASW